MLIGSLPSKINMIKYLCNNYYCPWNCSYRSGDGSSRDESGALKYRGTPAEAMGGKYK